MGQVGFQNTLAMTVPTQLANDSSLAPASTAFVNGLIPAGVVFPWAGAAAPTGYLMCDGSAVSRTTYSKLFTAVGTAFGVGDGSTTFNVPDMRGRVAAGKDDMGGSAASRLTAGGSGVAGATLGASGGAETHTLTLAQSPAHSHAPETGGNGGSFVINGSAGAAAALTGTGAATWGQSSTDTKGGGGAHNNTQPTIVLNHIIKAV